MLALRMGYHLQDREPWKEEGGLNAIVAGALWCECRAALPRAVAGGLRTGACWARGSQACPSLVGSETAQLRQQCRSQGLL